MSEEKKTDLSVELRRYTASGLANIVSVFVLNPMDVMKTKLQIQNTATAAKPKYNGFLHCLAVILREEGPAGLLRGVTASIVRASTYSSIRMGAYEPIRNWIDPSPNVSLQTRILAGLLSGGIASVLTNPVEVVKTRFQARTAGQQFIYKNTLDAFVVIYRQEGMKGLYKGVVPSVIRASILTASQMASYDQIKTYMIRSGVMEDGTVLQTICAIISGLITSTVILPADVIKTRMMSSKDVKYKGTMDCLMQLLKNEGPTALFKGWTPNYLRLGPQFLISLTFYEYFRKLLGIGYS